MGLAVSLAMLLAATALGKPKAKTQLVLDVTPPTVEVFVDGHDKGVATKGRAIDVTPGYHVIKLTLKGDENEERIKFAAGQQTSYKYDFDTKVGNDSTAGEVDQPESSDSP
jgi:hypothetical protein